MPLSSLDPKSALIVIDLQAGIIDFVGADRAADVVKKAAALADAFRARNLPVVLVNVAGAAQGRTEQPPRAKNFAPEFSELLADLNPQPSDHRVTKRTWGAFTNTDLREYLDEQGVTQVVMAGISTSAGVESTARNAHEFGFNVAFATDAMMDASSEAHNHSLTRVFPRIGQTATTQEILDLLRK